jgi:uncharacterized DUF497 family protein
LTVTAPLEHYVYVYPLEYDLTKDAANRRKHGFSLEAGALVIERALQVKLGDGSDEPRWRAYGWVNGRAMMCVYTG